MKPDLIPTPVLDRIEHLVEYGDVYIPGFDRNAKWSQGGSCSFLSPAPIYRLHGTSTQYLIGVYTDRLWTLVNLNYLACDPYCDDPICVRVREQAVQQWKGVPAGGTLFAVTDVDPQTDALPNPVPYYVHIDDAQRVDRNGLATPIEVNLFGNVH
ncbi:hypothetical protein [Tsukamurella spumae]|uniref:Uncharacterized protein n=1 Tax=Tsukamurella spumae TaxID=44753 RepID=A0A846X360_9ACTN|nr:hypothetical protein [Tsukamurella spumae]NKY19531.1 hypothetical protein [Tsukamurella spumae]